MPQSYLSLVPVTVSRKSVNMRNKSPKRALKTVKVWQLAKQALESRGLASQVVPAVVSCEPPAHLPMNLAGIGSFHAPSFFNG